eukprot:jgi/Tetstr1/452212/TSEL_039248.t1
MQGYSVDRKFALKGRVTWGVIFAVLLLGGVGGWAGTAKLSGAVMGTGTVLVDEDIKVVQHPHGGIVREIAVREGDFVTAGQLLIRLEDAEIRAEKAIVEGQLIDLKAQRARLLAEATGSEDLVIEADFPHDRPGADQIIAGEQQVFRGGLERHRSQRDQLMLQVDQLEQEIAGLQFQRTATTSELALARSESDRLDRLVAGNLIPVSQVSGVERDIVRLEGQLGEIDTSIARAHVRISDVELQLLELDGNRQTEAQRQVQLIGAQIAEREERLSALVAQYSRTAIVAPVTGIVNELNVSTVGGVISAAEKLATVVPESADLAIEFRVAVHDIDQIRVGQPATLRFSAFNQRTTPEVEGEIVRVSAASQHDPATGERFFLAQVRADEESNVLENQLVPGMPVDVFVETEQQLAITYFLKPFTDQIARAFREE